MRPFLLLLFATLVYAFVVFVQEQNLLQSENTVIPSRDIDTAKTKVIELPIKATSTPASIENNFFKEELKSKSAEIESTSSEVAISSNSEVGGDINVVPVVINTPIETQVAEDTKEVVPIIDNKNDEVVPVESVEDNCLRLFPLTNVRSEVDRKDDFDGKMIHFLYVLPKDVIDESLDTNGTLVESINSFNYWLCQQSLGKVLRIDTYKNSVDITFVRLDATSEEIMKGENLPWEVDANNNPYVVNEINMYLENNDFSDPNKVYAIYYGGESNSSCGASMLGEKVAALYLKGGYNKISMRCEDTNFTSDYKKPGYLEMVMIHEIFHALGFVSSCSPNHTLNGHVSDSPRDLMYAGNEAWEYWNMILDYNNDDYYNVLRPTCSKIDESPFFLTL